ncbi:MAG: hypothetical protein HOC91_14075 [Nitrospinaceae bacterium]|jgi:hypothetical protein|nr:hypothetical protein [Nitrospinaceae bacterium]MBT3435834.1 hypothetical protein [Nitrospinaceae bacterium]MBT3822416.1 hypothetical protein [Nitrospinaceae bacterium]MBT4094113.1 hypothetical protein [Nitrospinaceae bacterium]MBT4431632.1 hypothetical protein [Nitrospinaceae bacterium]
MTIFEQYKGKYESLQNGLDALLDEAEGFMEWMDKMADEFEGSPDRSKQQLASRFRGGPQRREVTNFIEAIDGPAADALLRIYDRLNIIDLSEKGEFV